MRRNKERKGARPSEEASEAKGALGINWKEPCRFVVVDMFDVCVCVCACACKRGWMGG